MFIKRPELISFEDDILFMTVPATGTYPLISLALTSSSITTDSFTTAKIVNPGFASSKTLKITIQWSVADALTYFNVSSGMIVKI
jgi:hypothetical protein